MHLLAGFFLIAGVICLPIAAYAVSNLNAQIIEQAFLVDPSRSMTIEQISQAQFTPYSSSALNLGYSTSTTWIRLTLRASTSESSSVALRIEPRSLDSIDLYEKLLGTWVMSSAGDSYPYSQIGNDGPAFRLIVHPTPHQENQYYLKIKTNGLIFITVGASSLIAANQSSRDDMWFFGIQLGAFLLLLAWSTVSYLRGRDRVYGIFTIFLIIVILVNLSAWGILSRFIFPTLPVLDNLSFSYLFCLRTATSVWLGWAILRDFDAPKWYPILCQVFYGICLIQLIAITLGYAQIALVLNFSLAFLTPYFQLYAIHKSTKVPHEIRRLLIIGYAMISFILTLIFISVAGLIDIGTHLSTFIRWIGFINGIILFLIVRERDEISKAILKQDSLKLIVLQAQSATEKKLLEDRSTLIDMLVHELKNPLATIQMAIGSLKINLQPEQTEEHLRIKNMSTAVGNMNAVIERCMLVDQFDQNKMGTHIAMLDLKSWLEELLEEKEYVDRVLTHISEDILLQIDPQLLAIALGNLIDNAIKYAVNNSYVTIETCEFYRHETPWVSITISNQVDELGRPDPNKIFKRYYRNHYAKKNSGMGLGLYLTKAICTILGGEISYGHIANNVYFVIKLPTSPTKTSKLKVGP